MRNKFHRWLMPTNNENMKMIIAQSLICEPDGFEKYYRDPLEFFPGYIPVFNNKVPTDFLRHSISEAENLTPCIIEFDLSNIVGKVKAVKSGTIHEIDIADSDTENFDLLLIPAPLPLISIKKIIFESNSKKTEFINDTQNLYRNVPLTGLNFDASKKENHLFKSNQIDDMFCSDLKNIQVSKYKPINYKQVYAFGGMLLNLFYYSKNGSLSNTVFKSICSFEEINDTADYSIIANYFLYPKTNNSTTEIKKQILNRVINIAITTNKFNDFKNNIIAFLENNDFDDKTKKRSINIASTLREFDSALTKSVEKYFTDAKTSLEKSLLMLFRWEDSETLIDSESILFSEEDFLNFAMLLGIRDKFLNSPKFLREFSGLQHFISYKMAAYSHQNNQNFLKFNYNQEPLTVIDMLKNNDFKIWFAKRIKIDHCFETRFIIHIDNCKFKNAKVGMEIIMDGIVDAPNYEIKESEYFKSMATKKFKDYDKCLKKYKQLRG
jgi:hypothetical protein